ncbi:hypothetical protein C7974DRAFT_410180 [Boeremia exigua]|uniref:uncharacterized protein n=1 Tax=Boeremia exigua TaxID=749465 RepID=UPI001E8E6CF9|nr:uncharacterized protein C7974DRAFT_410180 [Boeremia exigua]KAH6639201.1 hypothetical protein C7974DRAFT_410180 [Boeremia exigua]
MSANSPRNGKESEDKADTDLGKGREMAVFVITMLMDPVKDIQQGNNGGTPDPDYLEEGLMPRAFLGTAFSAVVGSSFSKTICENLKNEGEGKSPKLPERRYLDDFRDSARNQGILVGMPGMLLESVLKTTVLNSARRFRVAQQIRDSFYLVERRGALSSEGSTILKVRAVEGYDIFNDIALADPATFVGHLSAFIDTAAEIPKLTNVVEYLRPEMDMLNWQISQRIEEQRFRDTGLTSRQPS